MSRPAWIPSGIYRAKIGKCAKYRQRWWLGATGAPWSFSKQVFRCRIHGSLDAALAAEQAYRAVVLESTRDLRGLAARLGSDWGKTVPDMAVAVRRFETFLAGWRAHTGDVWPNDEWESLLAECHRLIAMRRTEIEELRARAALNLTLTSLAIALAALVVAVIPLGLPGYIAVALADILTAVMVFIAYRVGHIVSGDRPITLS